MGYMWYIVIQTFPKSYGADRTSMTCYESRYAVNFQALIQELDINEDLCVYAFFSWYS